MNMKPAHLWSQISSQGRSRLCTVAALALLLVGRLLPSNSLDLLLGRAGDSTLLLAVLLLLIALFWRARVAAKSAAPAWSAPANLHSLLKVHLDLEQAIDSKLVEVAQDTENSALSIITEVRGLYDSANMLVQYLETSSPQANSLGSDIVNSVSYLVEIGSFIEELPAKMTRDLHSVQSVVQEITELSSLVGSVQAISMQSHLLAINAAIEGSRAGSAGAAFRVVADEMRLLAGNSSAVALRITAGLHRARAAVEGGMAVRTQESSKALHDVANAVRSIQKLQENFEDMSQYFKTRFAVITRHNLSLSHDIAEVLGHIQYQDVVSQCIERIRKTQTQRGALFQSSVDSLKVSRPDIEAIQKALIQIQRDFAEQEDLHKHSARHDEQAVGEAKFELF